MKRVVVFLTLFIVISIYTASNLNVSAADPWAAGVSSGAARFDSTAVRMLDGRVLVAGGNNGAQINSAEIYNPSTDSWSTIANLGTARFLPTSQVLADGRVMVIGGNNGSPLNTTEIYNPLANSWVAGPNLGTARSGATSATLTDGRILVIGGWDGTNRLNTTEIYDPATNNWSPAASMGTARNVPIASVLSDGRVIVAGGTNGANLNTCEIYNPSTDSWAYGPNISMGKVLMAAATLPDGRVMVIGGSNGSPVNNTEIYSTSTNTWTLGPTLGTSRYGASAVTLLDGRVMVIGGNDSITPYLNTTEIGAITSNSPQPTTPMVTDIANNGDGRDIQVTFNGASNETNISEYRIFVVPYLRSNGFMQPFASTLASARYVVEAKNGPNGAHTVTLTQSLLDSIGSAVANGVEYKVFVMAAAQNSYNDTLSAGSAVFQLTSSIISSAYNNPPLPSGFTYMTGTWNTGYVIADSSGNEWVWVPAGGISGGFTRRDWGQGYTVNQTAEAIPQSVTDAVNNMGGFYVMRYEASGGGVVQSKANQTVWSYITWNASNTVSDSMDTDLGYPVSVSTHLLYDAEWDTVLKWMQDGGANLNDSSSWGNYGTDPYTGSNGGMVSGARAEFKIKNIYDIAGNYWEWVQGNETTRKIVRGGTYDSNGAGYPAAYRNSLNPGSPYFGVAFRAALVITSIPAPSPTTPAISDIADNMDARDVQVTFNGASDETNISGYRVFVVPSVSAGTFTQSTASGLAAARYYTEAKSGANAAHTITLSQSLLDSSGNPISNGTAYKVFVLAVGQNSYTDTLSSASGALTLTTIVYAPAATTPTASDIANNGDGRDIRAVFNGASDETNISGYRIYVVPAASAGTFVQSTASGLAAARYVAEAKNGNNGAHTLNLTQPLLDSTGAAILNNNSYKIFVLSVGQNGYNDKLSSASGTMTLMGQLPPSGGQPLVFDIANNGDGRDIKVSFRGAINEMNISGYRIFVVPSASAGTFTAVTAASLGSGRYLTEGTLGAKVVHTVTLTQPLLDSAGAAITTGTPYKVFVLSVGQNGYGYSLSPASQLLTLNGSGSVTSLTQVTVPKGYDIANNGDGRDLKVTFKALYHEENVTEYRIIVVPDSSAGTFNVSGANGLAAARYLVENKTGPRKTHTVTLNNTLLDSAGSAIANSTAYRVFILAVAVSGNGDNSLSVQSPLVTLLATVPAVSAVTNLAATDTGSNNNASDIQVRFTAIYSETNVQEYRIFVVPSASAGTFDLTAANANTNYQTEAKTTARAKHIVILNSSLNDSTGAVVSNGNPYRVFVLTIGQNSYANRLSRGTTDLTVN